MFILCLGLLLWISTGSDIRAAQAQSSEIGQTVREQTEDVREEAAKTKELLGQEKSRLRSKLESLKDSVSGLEDSLEEKKDELTGLQENKESLQEKLQSEKEEVEAVQGTLVAAAKNLDGLIQKSPLGPGIKEQVQGLRRVAQRQDLPRMKEIRSVVNTAFHILEDSGRIQRFSGTYTDAAGHERSGTVVRIGGINALYDSQQGTGYLRPQGDGLDFTAAGGELPWLTRRGVRAYIAGEQEMVPVDISNGSVFAQMSRERTWGEWVRAGGFLVWPLFGIAGLALILVGERLIFMLRIRSNADQVMDRISQLAKENQWETCREYCAEHWRSPLCRVLNKALDHVGESQQVVENALQEGVLGQLPRLERFLPTLNVLAAIAPLLGLLGTVTGMISTFQAITVFGTGEPKVMAGGISEALITTQIGLGVAVPIMFLHHLLDRRVDKIIGD
ncbi:MAG: DUF3450 family protein, partial [Desulfovermiculus sp.]